MTVTPDQQPIEDSAGITSSPPNGSTRGLWLALMVFFALVVGLVAGLLAWAGGDNPFAAVRSGGTGFGGTILVLFAIFYFATHGSSKS